jgi:hypothetical protein
VLNEQQRIRWRFTAKAYCSTDPRRICRSQLLGWERGWHGDFSTSRQHHVAIATEIRIFDEGRQRRPWGYRHT